MASLDDIFKAYDIRALVPEQLDAPLARKVGSAFAAFAGAPGSWSARTCGLPDPSWWRPSPRA